MLAVKHGKADLVELLLNNGAAVNLQDSEGSTALIYAVEHGSLNIVKLLLTKSECDVNIADNVNRFFFLLKTPNPFISFQGWSNSCNYCNE